MNNEVIGQDGKVKIQLNGNRDIGSQGNIEGVILDYNEIQEKKVVVSKSDIVEDEWNMVEGGKGTKPLYKVDVKEKVKTGKKCVQLVWNSSKSKLDVVKSFDKFMESGDKSRGKKSVNGKREIKESDTVVFLDENDRFVDSFYTHTFNDKGSQGGISTIPP